MRLWRPWSLVQPDLTLEDRRSVVGDLLTVGCHTRFTVDTVCSSIQIFDQFLQVRRVPARDLLAVGFASMHLASKFEEEPLPCSYYVEISKGTVTADTLRAYEFQIWEALRFQLPRVTPPAFLSMLREASELTTVQQAWSLSYILRICLLDYSCFLHFKPSMIAASIIFLARALQHQEWTAKLALATTYSLEQLIPCVMAIKKSLKAEAHSLNPQYVSRCFAKDEYVNISTIVLQFFADS